MKAGTLICTCSAPRSSGIQRQRSMLMMIFCMLARLGAGLALGAGLEQRLVQPLELLMLGMQPLQIDFGLRRVGDLGQ